MSDNTLEILRQIVDLISHLAWPVATIILLLLIRRSIGIVAAALAEKIKDPHSTVSASYGDAKIGVVGSGPANESKDLFDKLESDPELEKRLNEWLKKENLNLTPTELVFNAGNKGLLKRVREEISW